MLAFVPQAGFELEQGRNALTSYRFATRSINHLFCSSCGIKSFAEGSLPDGTPMVAVNVRCLEGVDLATLKVQHFDSAIR